MNGCVAVISQSVFVCMVNKATLINIQLPIVIDIYQLTRVPLASAAPLDGMAGNISSGIAAAQSFQRIQLGATVEARAQD